MPGLPQRCYRIATLHQVRIEHADMTDFELGQGYDLVMSKEAQSAFDINTEDDKTRERYGRNDFGQRCLLARRLVEGGVPFVTVYDGGWDSHSNIFGGMRSRLPNWDASVWALIDDLEQRGLLDSTLVLALGEFLA